ncbi:DnaB-like helicase C-terminal domain-containing protein, partial [Vibrio parahaemolyticus]
GTTESTVKTFGQAATLAVKMAERAHNAGGGLSGTTTGFDSLNSKLGGLHKSDLVIVAGRPGMGKSSLASNIAFNAAARW